VSSFARLVRARPEAVTRTVLDATVLPEMDIRGRVQDPCRRRASSSAGAARSRAARASSIVIPYAPAIVVHMAKKAPIVTSSAGI